MNVYDKLIEKLYKMYHATDSEKKKRAIHDKIEILQHKSAEEYERKFRESLEFPMGEGLKALRKLKKLLNEKEEQ
jgi:hypothetical protein